MLQIRASEGRGHRGANRFHRKLSEEGFFCGFAASAGASLSFVTDEELQTAAGPKTGEDGPAALLGLIVDGNATACEKTSEWDAPCRDWARGVQVMRRQRRDVENGLLEHSRGRAGKRL